MSVGGGGGADPAGGLIGGQPGQPAQRGARGRAIRIEEGDESTGVGVGVDLVTDAGRDDRGVGNRGATAAVGEREPAAGDEQDLHGGMRMRSRVADTAGERHQPGAEHHATAPSRHRRVLRCRGR
ncbi:MULTISPECIES: hypothetical protein [Nocardia]|uniref:hypothetical protein n=1 Tax=Nocardia TaxID=1817 RepID=UPI0006843AF9|nr:MULTISPECIES: hypothetical protein [Nocardia]